MKLFSTVILVLFFALPVYGGSDKLMIEMIDFITKRTNYEYQGEPLPLVKLKPVDELCQAVYSSETLKKIDACTVAGYYDPAIETIFIADESGPYMVDEYFFETVLIHEMVHYLQYLNGTDHIVSCINELETDAYYIQKEYVEYMNYPAEQKPDPMFAMIVSNCNNAGWFLE